MKENDESFEGSKSSYSNNKSVEEADKSSCGPKNGDSITSNSGSVDVHEESDQKKQLSAGAGSARRYLRSKTPRLRWTPDLHLCFVHAVERLGGQDRATPKLVQQLMGIRGLSIAHVKSHLQMYRSKKMDDPNQGKMQGLFFEGGDHHIYKLSQLPVLQNFNQRSLSDTSRYGGDSAWRSCHGQRTFYNPFMGAGTTAAILRAKQYYHGSVPEKILGSRNHNQQHLNFGFLSNFSGQTTVSAARQSPQDMNSSFHRPMQQSLKRKSTAMDSADCSLDLNLSLKVLAENKEALLDRKCLEGTDEIEGSLSLSLPSSSELNRLKQETSGGGSIWSQARKASTLDLTL